MANNFENWNENPELWKSIEDTMKAISKSLSDGWVEDSFKNFFLTNKCYTERNNALEMSNFIVVGEFTIQKTIQYSENRNTENKKKWNKEKQNIESNFKLFFKDFQLPEQSFKSIVNPLLNKTAEITLYMNNYSSEQMSYEKLQKLLDLEDSDYSNRLSFKLEINKSDSSLSEPVRSGVNEIENNKATIQIKIYTYISSPIEYCQYVLNSNIMSEILFKNYLDSQLQAYLGYKNYPNPQINVLQVEKYPFDIDENYIPYRTAFPSGQIYYLPKTNINYEQYINETKKVYDENKKEIICELSDINSIKNKVFGYNNIVQQFIYTDNFGKIQLLDLFGSDEVSFEQYKILSQLDLDGDRFQDFLNVLNIVYSKIDKSYKINIDLALSELEELKTISEITSDKCPKLYEILNACYNSWDSVNIDLITLMKNKIFLQAILFKKEEKNTFISINDLKTMNLPNNIYYPVELVRNMKQIYKNQLTNFPEFYRDFYYITRISAILESGNSIRRVAVITNDELNFYNKLQNLSQGKFNGIILNQQTIRDLYKDFGENLVTYLKTASVNTVFIINPNVFFESSCLGDSEICLANKIDTRYLVNELLKAVGLDYTVVFKYNELGLNSFLTTCIRQVFAGCKYREIYGPINYNDMIVVDPNSSVLGESSSLDIKENISISKEEAEAVGNIKDISCVVESLRNIHLYDIGIEYSNSQGSYYKEIVDSCYNNLMSDKDFQQQVANSDLDNPEDLMPYISNFLSISDIFLNCPNNDLFSFKDKFEEEDNDNLESQKLSTLYSIIASHLYSGVVNGTRFTAKNGKIVIVCENRIVVNHLYKRLKDRFYGDICGRVLTNNLEQEKSNYSNKRIIFIARDILNSGFLINDVSDYVIVQPSWDISYLEDIYEYALLSQGVVVTPDINIFNLYFEKSLEVNKVFNAYNFYIKDLMKKTGEIVDGIQKLPDTYFDFNSLVFRDSTDIQKYQINKILMSMINLSLFESYKSKKTLINTISKKYSIDIEDAGLFDICMSSIANNDVSKGNSIYIPFINNMTMIDPYGIVPLFINEKFSDLNGNAYKYKNGHFQSNAPIFTQFGSGYITSENKEDFVVDVIKLKEFLVSKDLVYVATKDCSSFMEYIAGIKAIGDSKLDLNIYKETKLDKKDESIETDEADNSLELSVNRINGLFSIYSTAEDLDNVRLQNFDFNKFTNVFVIPIKDENIYNRFMEILRRFDFDDKYLNIFIDAYKEFSKGKEFIIPEMFNYFEASHTKQEKPQIYVMIWNKNFYALLDGNFYQKVAYKISKRFTTSLIKNIYIQSFQKSKDCKYQLLKISKTLNILNLQELLNYFGNNYPNLEYLETTNSTSEEDVEKDKLIDFLKEKEKKLKEHIKQVREDKNL